MTLAPPNDTADGTDVQVLEVLEVHEVLGDLRYLVVLHIASHTSTQASMVLALHLETTVSNTRRGPLTVSGHRTPRTLRWCWSRS